MIVKLKKIVREMVPGIYGILGGIKRTLLINKFKRHYPETMIFDKPESKLYSQENQDYIVYDNFFKNQKSGIFCDIGGNHPLNINNTRYFEEKGWSGYVFEPLEYMRPLWEKYRKARFFPYAASDSEGEVTFSVVKNASSGEDMFSFVKETRDNDKELMVEDITVQTRLLKDVFEEESMKHIDYMSIDVEGHEFNVIKGIDFDETRINVLTIENNSPGYRINGDDRIRRHMFENNYVLWGRIVELDDIYVNKEFLASLD